MDDRGRNPWDLFEVRLRALLTTMGCPEDEICIEAPTQPPTMCTICWDDGLQVYWSHESDREPGHSPDQLARAVRRMLEHDQPIPHPQLASASAEGPCAIGLGILGLDTPADHHQPGLAPAGRAHLQELICEQLDELAFDYQCDDDGDPGLVVAGCPVSVTARPDGQELMVVGKLVDHVRSRAAAAIEVNVLNRRNWYSRWVLSDREIYQLMRVPMPIWQPELFRLQLHDYLTDLTIHRGDLVDRLGGRVA